MEEAIYHWIYVSSASTELSQPDLDELLAKSAQNNQQLNLTGLLLFSKGRFMQILEGSRENLLQAKKRIERDQRHKSVDTLRFEMKQGRDFKDWKLSYFGPAQVEQEGFSRFLMSGFDESSGLISDSEIYRMLVAFRKEYDRRSRPRPEPSGQPQSGTS